MVLHLYVLKVVNFILNFFYKIDINGFLQAGVALIISFVISIFVEKYFSFLYKVKK